MAFSLFRILLGGVMVFTSLYGHTQGSVSATYSAGDIPTSFAAFDPACNGSNIILELTLPDGDAYSVTGINISYSMTASGGGQLSHQRSQVKCVNSNITEFFTAAGTGNTAGTFTYNRTATIANGTYAGGTVLRFELHAWRTVDVTPGCNTSVNKVDAGTWTITVNHGAEIVTGKTGINNATPISTLDVSGKIRVGDDIVAPAPGMIRWNSSTNDFEGFNGSQWVSLTNKYNNGWGVIPPSTVNENSSQTSSNGNADDFFGFSVRINGDYAIVGAPIKDTGFASDAGCAYIFKRNGGQWQQQAILTASDYAANDLFGYSVSISGDFAIVGAPNRKDISGFSKGAAYIFIRTGTAWVQQAVLTAGDAAINDEFGYSVAISGDYAVIGAPSKATTGFREGKAYIFSRSTGAWLQQAMLVAPAGISDDRFGFSVGISGNTAIIGLIGLGNSGQGKAFVFNRSDTAWIQQAMFTPSDTEVSHFGYSVDISGNDAIVGCNNKLAGNNKMGKAFVFSKMGSNWSEQAILTPSDSGVFDAFGSSVCINGDYAIAGAYSKNVGDKVAQGKSYIYNRTRSAWAQQAILLASDGTAGDFFGYSVSISGNYIIAGAHEKAVATNSSPGTGQGKVYFFSRQ